MMKSEIGYEHYFLNYFLYLPFSQKQEESVLKESLKLMNVMGIKKFGNSEELKQFLEGVRNLFDDIKKFCDSDVKEIKKGLNMDNKKRVEIILGEFRREGSEFNNLFPNHFTSVLKGESNENRIFYDENDKILSNFIYGDYIYNNENVEVFLHQRTMKKVRYKKRSYSAIHPINKELIDKITKEAADLLNDMNSGDYLYSNTINDKLVEEIKKLKEKF